MTKEDIDYEIDDQDSDDLGSYIWDGIKSFPFFLMFISIILYILTYSNVFNNTLYSIDESLINNTISEKSTKGVVVTGILFGLLLATLQSLKNGNVI